MRRRRHSHREVRALEAALDWAQNLGYQGEQLPKGDLHRAGSCPLAKASDCVIAAGLYVRIGAGVSDLPPLVAEFVNLFDKNRYPELIA